MGTNDTRAGREPSDSLTTMTELVLPQHTNTLGNAFGGTIMGWMDICAAVVAQRHSGEVAVTASVDALDFHAPIRVGDLVCLTGRVNAVFRSSMEIEVRVEVEDRRSRERSLCVDAFMTFVSLDADGEPLPLPPLVVATEQEKRREAAAKERRAARLAHRQKSSPD